HLPPQVAVSNASRKSRVRRAQATLPGTMLARTFFHHLVPARMKIDQIWQRDSWQSSSALRMFESRTVLRTTATQTVTTRKQSAGPMHVLAVHARRLHFALMKSNHESLTQSSVLILSGAKPATKDEMRHPHSILHLRDTMDRARSRPSMQFAQAGTPNQPE